MSHSNIILLAIGRIIRPLPLRSGPAKILTPLFPYPKGKNVCRGKKETGPHLHNFSPAFFFPRHTFSPGIHFSLAAFTLI